MRAIELYEYHETKTISLSPEIIDKIKKDCAIALSSNPIYRGIEDEDYIDVLYGKNPNKPRKSAYTSNYYTIMMDELPSWRNFPKRSLSWICSGSRNKAGVYGRIYRVLPVGNPKIVVGSDDDIWTSFDAGINNLLTPNFKDLNDVNETLDEICSKRGYNDVENLDELSTLVDLSAKDQLNGIQGNESKYDELFVKPLLNDVIGSGGFIKLMDEVMDPELNYIKMYNLKSIPSGNLEMWFSEQAYFIEQNVFNQVFSKQ